MDPIRCRHVHTEGRQCGSPALRGEKLCYHHHAARRPLARRTDTSLLRPHLPHPEDLHAVQSGIAELLRLISLDQLDPKQGKLLLATLALASANLARIERNRRASRVLALAEARFAVKHPEACLSGCHSRSESASVPATNPTSPETGCPTFGAASPRLRWVAGTLVEEPPVTDLVHDPELGSIAPGPDPEPRPEDPLPAPTPLQTPAAPGITPEENLARFNAAAGLNRRARSHSEVDIDASIDPARNPEITPYLLSNVRSTFKIEENRERQTSAQRPDYKPRKPATRPPLHRSVSDERIAILVS